MASEFFENCINFLPDVDVCCYSLSLFVGSIMSSLACLAYFLGQFYKGLGFTVGYYVPEKIGSPNSIVGLFHTVPTTLLLICALVGLILSLIFIVGYCYDVPHVIGPCLVFFGLLVVLFEIIWVLFVVVRVFLGGGAMYSCNATHTHEICTDDLAALGFFVTAGFAMYCLIVIKSYIQEH